jgi:hypothetical protein
LILADAAERVVARLAKNENAASREYAAVGWILPLRSHRGCRAARDGDGKKE